MSINRQASVARLRQELKSLHTQCQAVEQELETSAVIGQQLLQHNQELRQKVQTAVEHGLTTPTVSPVYNVPSGDYFGTQLMSAVDEDGTCDNDCGVSEPPTSPAPCKADFGADAMAESQQEHAEGLAQRVFQLQACLAEVVDDWSNWESNVSEELHMLRTDMDVKSKTTQRLQQSSGEGEAHEQELQERVYELERQLEDEREANRLLSEQNEKLEQQHRKTEQEAQGLRDKRRTSQTELLGVVEDSDAAHRKLEEQLGEVKTRLSHEQEQGKQLQKRLVELEEQLGESMADGARYHCQLVQARQSLADSQEQCQQLPERASSSGREQSRHQSLTSALTNFDTLDTESVLSSLRPYDTRNIGSTGSTCSLTDADALETALQEATIMPLAGLRKTSVCAISRGEVDAQDDRIEELQNDLDETEQKVEAAESKCAHLEMQSGEAENLIKDLQTRLRAQGAAHVADLEYLADAEARASALVTAAADALKAKDAELNVLRSRIKRLQSGASAPSSSGSSVCSSDDDSGNDNENPPPVPIRAQ